MTLITLLIVIALERVTDKNPDWHIHALTTKYRQRALQISYIDKLSKSTSSLLLSLIPAILLYFLVEYAQSLLIQFIIGTIVVWVCLGCPVTRKSYKAYLRSANNKDFQACSLHSMSFGNKDGDLNKVAEQLVYVNYRQYASIILWFLFFGAPGVLFYSILKELHAISSNSSHCNDPEIIETVESIKNENHTTRTLDLIISILDWVPVRITSFGFMVVGHFSQATSVWVQSLFDFKSDAKSVLYTVSSAAEEVEADDNDCVTRPCTMVKLLKRNVSFLLVLAAILTMVGAIG